MSQTEPAIKIPPLTAILTLVIIAIHAGINLTDDLTKAFIWNDFAIYIPNYDDGVQGGSEIWSFITYAFLHANWSHVIMNLAVIVTFGSAIEKLFGARKILIVFILSVLIGAISQILFTSDGGMMIGASAGANGLFGFMLLILSKTGQLARTKQQFWFILAIIVLINVFSGHLTMPGVPDGGNIAWIAHIGGLAIGLILGAYQNVTRLPGQPPANQQTHL